jgi:AcrR family transcriptional regulator
MSQPARKQRARVPAATRRRGSLDETLINAAMDLFASYGYRGTSLARIARAAGVTKGALYWHFDDKEDFFLAVADRVLGEWAEVFENQTPARDAREFRDRFTEIFETTAELNERNPWVSRLLLIVALESHKIGPRVLRAMRRANARQLANLESVIKRGLELGVFRADLDVASAATQVWSATVGLEMLWYLRGPQFALRKSLRRAAADFLRHWGAAK